MIGERIRTMRALAASLALLGAVATAPQAQAQARAGKEHIASRIERVETLTRRSSAARAIDESSSNEAKARRDDALAMYDQAVAAYESGDYATADDLLSKATRTMFEAARLADPTKVLAKKRSRDFRNRLQSIEALLDAHARVSAEKNAQGAHQELRLLVDDRVERAKRLEKEGKVVDGRKVLDEAYVAIKVAIEALRGGDTLVRTLNFASKEEEYHYELERNDSFRMLVDVLIAEKIDSNPQLKGLIDSYLGKAAETRARAEEQAAGGDFESAVSTMEEATKQMGRAIRAAGVYIPGG